MNPNELLNLIAEALEVEPGTVTADTRIADVDEWNSIGWLTIMSLVDERLNVQINSKDVRGFKTAGEVVDHVLERASLV
jgi:acyl carrier protein